MDSLLAYGSDEGSAEEKEKQDVPGAAEHAAKRTCLPAPLPPTVVPVDDSARHKGKIRSFPHVEGNYPSHAYIPITPPKEHILYKIVKQLLGEQPLKLELYEGDMHLSLSRPFALRQMQITPFAESLRDVCSEKRFYLELDGWKYFVNDERTRSFFALTVKAGKPQACHSLRLVDGTMKKFAQLVYNANPQPHVTIGWILGDILDQLPSLEGHLESPCTVEVQRVECKIGKYVYEYDLGR